MNKNVAFIRGINVGRAKRVAMADLRKLVTDLGYGDVRTLLNSGNVIFTADGQDRSAAAARIQEGLATRLGVSAQVMVMSANDFDSVVAENPLQSTAEDASRLLVAFLSNPADLALLKPLSQDDWTPEALAVGQRAAYLWCANGIQESKLFAAIGHLLGATTTTRNWATVTKMHSMLMNAP